MLACLRYSSSVKDAVLAGAVVFLKTGGVKQARAASTRPVTNDSGSDILMAGAPGSMLMGLTVEPEIGRDLLEIEADDAADAREVVPRQLEVELRPPAPLPVLSRILWPWISMTAALACRSRWTRNSTVKGRGSFAERIHRPDDAGGGGLPRKRAEALAAALVDLFRRDVFGEVLIGAVGAQHVGRAHAADATAMAVLRRAGRIVGRQIVERGGNPRRVEVIPERHALTRGAGSCRRPFPPRRRRVYTAPSG